ncbi:MAG: tetratricopeptide repeat protein [Phycisphaerales bacterium]|nr:MAG: tetratricopeptide repeat protein [Phycisphaerales bacterium]
MMLRKTNTCRKALILAGRALLWAIAAGAVVAFAGCESHTQSKKAAKERWDRASAQIKLTLAEQQYESQKYDQAAATVRKCISADPGMARAHLLLGKLLLTEGSTENAAAELRIAVELDKGLHEGFYWLGVLAQEKPDYERAYELYTKALEINPTNVDYILAVADVQVARDNSSAALALLTRKALALPQDVSLKVAAADLMVRVGQNDRAIELYREASLLSGDNAGILESLGYCYVFANKWSEAGEIFANLAEQCADEQKKKMYIQVTALCSMSSGRYDKAAHYYDKLSVAERDNAETWVNMGRAALGSGMARRALQCGQTALGLRPGHAGATVLVGCARYAEGDYDKAAQSFEKLVTDEQNAGFAWLMMARCYERLGREGQAEQAYRKALDINPDSKLAQFLVKKKGA